MSTHPTDALVIDLVPYAGVWRLAKDDMEVAVFLEQRAQGDAQRQATWEARERAKTGQRGTRFADGGYRHHRMPGAEELRAEWPSDGAQAWQSWRR